MTIGERIYHSRKKTGMSQEELAGRMDVTRQSISLWETDQTVPSLDSLIMLAEIFSISLDELCGKQSEKPSVSETASEATPQLEEKAGVSEIEKKPEENTNCLAYAETKYTPSLLSRINKATAKKFCIMSGVIIICAVLFSILIIVRPEINNLFLIIPALFIVLSAVFITGLLLSIKNGTANFLKLHPNNIVKIRLYRDRLDAESVSDNSQTKYSVPFNEIKSVKTVGDLLLVYFNNVLLPIELSDDANFDTIRKLLTASVNSVVAAQSKPIKKLLLAIFILTVASCFLALISVAVAASLSPLPYFTYTFPEYMWIFLLYLPLPLASLVLGIIYCFKRYKCKKNIVAGAIVLIVCLGFGTMGFTGDYYVKHDFGYVAELEQTIFVNLPNSGYVSYVEDTEENIYSTAMIKFDDKEEIMRIVSDENRFEHSIDFFPANFLDSYSASTADLYDYFMLYDVTCGEVNNVWMENHSGHRFIYLAYSADKNIMYVCDFVRPNREMLIEK